MVVELLPGLPGSAAGPRVLEAVAATIAAGQSSAILLHPPLPLVGASIAMERGRQQNDRTLADG